MVARPSRNTCDFISTGALRKNKEVVPLWVPLHVTLNHDHHCVTVETKWEGKEEEKKKKNEATEKERERMSEEKKKGEKIERKGKGPGAAALRTVERAEEPTKESESCDPETLEM